MKLIYSISLKYLEIPSAGRISLPDYSHKNNPKSPSRPYWSDHQEL